MKVFLIFLISGLLLSTYSFAQSPKALHHFMQSGPLPANETQYGNNPKAAHYVNAGDAKIYYEVYGKGKPIVILHGGIFGSMYEMHQFIDSLAKKYQVIAISTRGHGKSELGSQTITYEQKANDVLAAMNEVSQDSAIVLGFSDGAYAGYKLASMYPQKVKKLIAIGATELKPGKRNFSFDVKQAIALDSAYWEQQFTLMPEPKRLQEMFTKLGDMYNHLTLGEEFFKSIKCPVLVMAGDQDQNNSPTHVVATAQMITHSLVGIIPNCSHGVFLENFPAVWACITPFFETITIE